MVLKAFIFDLDGTLIDSDIDFRKMKRRSIRVLETSGVKRGLLSEDALNYDIEKQAREYLSKKGVSEEEIKKTFQKVSEIMNKIELEAVEKAKLLDGVVETLEKLKRLGLKIGIITRGCREYVDKILKKFELGRLFDVVAARDDVLKPKPDPEHPRYLMKILGIKPSEMILVGDHLLDVLCAENAGIRCIWVKRKNNENIPIKPDWIVESIMQVEEIAILLLDTGNKTGGTLN